MTDQTNQPAKSIAMEIIEGGRARLETEIVEDLFLGRYGPAKTALLKRRGSLRLVVCRSQEETPKKGERTP